MDTDSAPLVSVIIPTYNRALTLPRAMNSVLQQGYKNLELLVIDDGSKDNTDEVMATFTDPRIRYVKMERNQGQSAARNQGMRLAKGDFIAFQDSDDEWLSGKLEKMVAGALGAGTSDVAVFHSRIVYGRDEARVYGVGRACCVPRLPPATGERDFVKISHQQNLISPQTLMISRSIFEKVGFWDKLLKTSVDWDYSLRVVNQAKMVFIEEPLVMAYIQDDSISVLRGNRVRSQLRILLKLQRQPGVDPGVLGDHFARVGMDFGRIGKPRMGRKVIWRSIQLAPTLKNWARLFVTIAKGFAPKAARA